MNVITLKWGELYGSELVNQVYAGVKRYAPANWIVHCLTDNKDGIHPDVVVWPLADYLPKRENKWANWRKLCMYNPNFPLEGPCLFMDIDIQIVGNLEPLVENWGGKLCMIDNWVGEKTKKRGWYAKGQSSVVLYHACHTTAAWDRYHSAEESDFDKYPGEQGWVYDTNAPDVEFFPEGTIVSFKKHCIPHFPLNLLLTPKPGKNSSVVCFHGSPNPAEAIAGYRGGRMKRWCRPTPWAAKVK